MSCQKNKNSSFRAISKEGHEYFILIFFSSHFLSAQVQTPRLQDADHGREAAEEYQLQEQPEEVRGARPQQQHGEDQQNVRQGTGPQLPLSGERR